MKKASQTKKGITYHSNGTHYKVIVKCSYCHRQYKTGWGTHQEPYDELTAVGWAKGRDRTATTHGKDLGAQISTLHRAAPVRNTDKVSWRYKFKDFQR